MPLYDGPAVIQLGDLIIHPGEVVDGVRWEVHPIGGWYGPAAMTVPLANRTSAHGAWASETYLEPAVYELKGTLISHSWADLSKAVDRLVAAIPSFGYADLIHSAPGAPVLVASVRQSGQPLIDRDEPVVVPWSISLVAPDPRKYALDPTTGSTGLPQSTGGFVVDDSTTITNAFVVGDSTTSGVLTVTNEGNMATPWTATLTGPVPAGASVTLRSGGLSSKVLRIPDAVATGRTLVLDSDLRSGLVDGAEPRPITGTWFHLEPGVNEIAFSAPSYDPGALLSVAFRSAWK